MALTGRPPPQCRPTGSRSVRASPEHATAAGSGGPLARPSARPAAGAGPLCPRRAATAGQPDSPPTLSRKLRTHARVGVCQTNQTVVCPFSSVCRVRAGHPLRSPLPSHPQPPQGEVESSRRCPLCGDPLGAADLGRSRERPEAGGLAPGASALVPESPQPLGGHTIEAGRCGRWKRRVRQAPIPSRSKRRIPASRRTRSSSVRGYTKMGDFITFFLNTTVPFPFVVCWRGR